jgi:hypothetical protein
LSETGKVGKVDRLIKSYGITQKQDNKTHKDILVQRFFGKILKIFIEKIESELKKLLPKEVAKNIHNNFYDHSQVIISNDDSNVNATMIIKEFDEDDEEEIDKDDDDNAEDEEIDKER